MARDGSGNYSLPEAAFVANTTIQSSKVNNNFSDIATALTGSLAANGEKAATGNQPMGGFKHTGVGDAAARNQYAATGQVQDSAFVWGGTSGGTANAQTLTVTPSISAYAAGQTFTFIAGASTTGASTLNVSGVGAKTVKMPGGQDTGTGSIVSGLVYDATYDGTNFVLKNARITGEQTIYCGALSAVSQIDIALTGSPKLIELVGTIYVSADAAGIAFRTSTNAGVSFDAGASDYLYNVSYVSAAAPTWTTANVNTSTSLLICSALDATAATATGRFHAFFFPGDGTRYPSLGTTCWGNFDQGAGAYTGQLLLSGQRASATTVNAVRLLPSSGTISGYLNVKAFY